MFGSLHCRGPYIERYCDPILRLVNRYVILVEEGTMGILPKELLPWA